MEQPVNILIIDDDPNICEVIRLYVEHEGYRALLLHEGNRALAEIRRHAPSLIVLDVMLPDLSGMELCSRLRSEEPPYSQIPVIMLTAKGESMDKLRGFQAGVDDYIVKPFDPNELIARIKAVLRRMRPSDQPQERPASSRSLRADNLSIDLEQYKVTVDNQRVELTPKEIELLYFLVKNPNRVYSREDLLNYVWSFDFNGGTRTVDAHVKNLRKKLGQGRRWSIQTLWGVGYVFEVKHEAD